MDVTGNPWIVTAADVAGLAAISGLGNSPGDIINIGGIFYLVVWKGAAHIVQIVFEQYTSDADTAQVFRYNGRQFASLNGAVDLESVRVSNMAWTNDGIIVPSGGITTGQISIYHR